MPKILNLDEISSASDRELVLKGKTYPLSELTVDDFIETSKVADQLATVDLTFAQQVEATIELITKRVPGVPRADLTTLTIDKLQAIAAFVRGVDPEQIVKMLAKDSPEAIVPAAEGTPAGN